jgi:hypothetical protein
VGETSFSGVQMRPLVTDHKEYIALVKQLLAFVVDFLVDCQYVCMKTLRPGTGKIVVASGIELSDIVRSLDSRVIAVEQVPIDLVAKLTRERKVWSRHVDGHLSEWWCGGWIFCHCC